MMPATCTLALPCTRPCAGTRCHKGIASSSPQVELIEKLSTVPSDVCCAGQAVRPEQVVLEVCRSRTAVMYDTADEEGGAPSTSSRVPNSMSLRCFRPCSFHAQLACPAELK